MQWVDSIKMGVQSYMKKKTWPKLEDKTLVCWRGEEDYRACLPSPFMQSGVTQHRYKIRVLGESRNYLTFKVKEFLVEQREGTLT